MEGAGIRVDRLRGTDLKPKHWDAFYEFYRNTTGTHVPCATPCRVPSPGATPGASRCIVAQMTKMCPNVKAGERRWMGPIVCPSCPLTIQAVRCDAMLL